MDSEIVLQSNSKENDKELLMIFLMKDFIKNHSLEKLSPKIFDTLVKNDYIDQKNLDFIDKDSNLTNIKNLILQNIPNKDMLTTSRFLRDFNIENKIGYGGFGTVLKVNNKLDKKNYAVKIINMNHENTDIVLREVENLSLLNHPNIIRYFGSWVENIEINEQNNYLEYEPDEFSESESLADNLTPTNYVFLQMELAENSLKNLKNNLSYVEKLDIFKQIVRGINEIHKNNIIHRDLKPSNILIVDGIVKIGDFGLSRYLEQNGNNKPLRSNLTGELGSYLYSSPEQLRGDEYDHRADIYSLGIILFELLNNFDTEMEKNIKIMNLKKGIIDEDFEEKYLKFIKILINEDYKKRPNSQKILEMVESI